MGSDCFPRHRAAASLKPVKAWYTVRVVGRFPRHRAAASLKLLARDAGEQVGRMFSAASGRGLIEAGYSGMDFDLARFVFRGIGPRPH